MRGFRDLRVWQAGMDLVESVYKVTEGQSRQHLKEYLNFLSMAQGSIGELETELEEIISITGALGRQIRALRSALEKSKG